MPPKQQPSEDPEVLDSQVRQARADLNTLTVQGELIINEAKTKAETYEKRAADLKDSIIPDLLRQEAELTQKVADLSDQVALKEGDAVEAQAALARREQDLNLREQRIKARESQHSSQIRRQLSE